MPDTAYADRSLSLDDADRCAEISTAVAARAGADEQFRSQDLLTEWTEPGYCLGDSSLGIVNKSGNLIAYAVFVASEDPPVRPWFNWAVDPACQHGDIRPRLLAWAIDRGRAVITKCPPEARVSLWGGVHRGYCADELALRAAGFARQRVWHEMRIDMLERPTPKALPAGFIARPYRHDEDLPILVDLVRDAFSDHFGHIEQSFDRDLERFRHWLEGSSYFAAERVMLAAHEATGVVAGSVMPMTEHYRRPGLGYIDTVGVRKAYRRQGLAAAMLTNCLVDYWDRGIKSVCLEVDGESLTNAMSLYERVGMHVHSSYDSYELLLRDGIELAKVAAE
jgi:ribosomal protein S18 acetylase RimI-like enzyme